MTELEELLRSDLLAATDDITDDLDPVALLATGHRARRSRTTRRVVAAAAVAAVATTLGWSVLGSNTTKGVPPVMSTPSATVPAKPPAVGATGSVRFGSVDDTLPERVKVKEVTVAATALADGYEVVFTVVGSDGSRSTTDATSRGGEIAWVQATPNLLVGFVPHSLDWLQYVDVDEGGAFGAFASDTRPIPNLDATAVYRAAEGKGGQYGGLRGYLWRDPTGAFHDGLGNDLPSATITLPASKQTGTFYLSEDLGQLGFQHDASSLSMKPDDTKLQDFGGWAGETGGLAVTGVVLPVGASDPSPATTGDDLEWRVARLDGRLVMVVSAVMPNDNDRVVSEVTYTDAAGKRVTEKTD